MRGTCIQVQIGFRTSSLARGKYTGLVTVSDPNAVDAPQTIAVTVWVGSGIPDSLDLYAAPNSSTTYEFGSNSNLNASVVNPGGGPVISVLSQGGGSFSFNRTYQVTARVPAGTFDGDYRGSFSVTGSTFTADNKTVPVAVHVTSDPIAVPSPTSVSFRIAQGAAKVDKWVFFSNSGLGTLSLSGVSGTTSWLTAKVQGGLVVLTADPTGLSPGTSTATITVASNAKNGPINIPVSLTVLATAGPTVFFQGVLDNALFQPGDSTTPVIAPGGIVAVTGEQFSTASAAQAASLPLGTSLGGATVFVNNSPVPIYYVSASHVINEGGQINFLIPYSTPTGEAILRVDRDGQRGNSVSVPIAAVAPRLLRLGIGDYAIAVFGDGYTFPIPATPGINSRPAKAGDALTFYALGMGKTTPGVTDGTAAPGAEPLARVSTPKVWFGQSSLPGTGASADAFFAGLTPGLVGLYQVNVIVPPNPPKGDNIPVFIEMNGATSNRVNIAVQ